MILDQYVLLYKNPFVTVMLSDSRSPRGGRVRMLGMSVKTPRYVLKRYSTRVVCPDPEAPVIQMI